jgi:phage tail sheath protein FI
MPIIYENTPGVWINEVRLAPPPIIGVGTSTAAFIGKAPLVARFKDQAKMVTSLDQFQQDFELDDSTPHDATKDAKTSTPLSRAVRGFFDNGGRRCYVVNVGTDAAADAVKGIKLLEPIDEVAIVAAPGQIDATVYAELKRHTELLGDRVAIYDPPAKQTDLTKLTTSGGAGNLRPQDSKYGAFYYPRVNVAKALASDPASEFVAPSGHVAGVYARVDSQRGVHKAPANEDVLGIIGVEHMLTDADQDVLNKEGVDVLRLFPNGNIKVWGARTLTASSAGDKAFLYINIRRLVNYIEESLQEGLSWAVFEPNNLTLQKQVSRAASAFLDGVWRDGALFGATTSEAYYVRFPELFNRDEDRAAGKLVVEIGLRVSYPAEFIIIRIGLLMQSAATA